VGAVSQSPLPRLVGELLRGTVAVIL